LFTFPPILALAVVAASLGLAPSAHAQRTTLTVATFPDLDRAAKAAGAAWAKLHPEIDLKIVSLQYADHHTAMTTALATGSGCPT
jgi:multiple sugar transport system substrate-binding protein